MKCYTFSPHSSLTQVPCRLCIVNAKIPRKGWPKFYSSFNGLAWFSIFAPARYEWILHMHSTSEKFICTTRLMSVRHCRRVDCCIIHSTNICQPTIRWIWEMYMRHMTWPRWVHWRPIITRYLLGHFVCLFIHSFIHSSRAVCYCIQYLRRWYCSSGDLSSYYVHGYVQQCCLKAMFCFYVTKVKSNKMTKLL